MIKYHSSCISHLSSNLSYPSPVTPVAFWLIVGGRLKPWWIPLYLFFAPSFDGQKDAIAYSPIIITLHAISPNWILMIRLIFGRLLHPPIQRKPSNLRPHCPLSFFVSLLNSLPKMTSKCGPPSLVSPIQWSLHHRHPDTIVRLVVASTHWTTATQ